jgi:hypothetical protein
VAESEEAVRMVTRLIYHWQTTINRFNEHDEIISSTTPGIRQREGRML